MLKLRKQSIYTKHRVLFIWAVIAVEVLLLATVAGLAVLAFGPLYIKAVEHPMFCGNLCHEMKPSYESYTKSAHNSIGCSECHSKPGVKGTFKGVVVDAAQEVYIHLSGEKFYNMDELNPEVSNSSCLREGCHKLENLVAKNTLFMDDSIFNHSVHLSITPGQTYGKIMPVSSTMPTPGTSYALNCTSCHSKNKESHIEVDKSVCFLCHFGSNVKMSDRMKCNSCHIIPASQHENTMSDNSTCQKCHATSKADIKVSKEKCTECHNETPEKFKGEMQSLDSVKIHKIHVETQGAGCMECHQALDQGHVSPMMAHFRKNCQSCHSKSQEMHLLADQQLCFLCHSKSEGNMNNQKQCLDCHKGPMPRHNMTVSDNKSCEKCHATFTGETSVPQAKCVGCHKDGVKQLDADLVHKEHPELKGKLCMECHQKLKRKHGELFAHYSEDCQKCHSTQEVVYKGDVKFAALNMPSPKASKVGCKSCHILVLEKGIESKASIKKTCLKCHEAGYEQILDEWQGMISSELKMATEMLSSIDKSLKASKDLPKKQEAIALYNKAREQISLVQEDRSTGAHNTELADQLLTDAIDKLKKCQQLANLK
jgi:hypothetical protein